MRGHDGSDSESLVLACGGIWAMCGGNTDAVWNEAEGEAFGGAVGEAKVVMPRVGECEEGSSMVRGGVVLQRGRIKSILVYR